MTNFKRMGIDLDGVLSNFTDSYARALWKETGILFPPNSDEWPTVWYWEREAGVTKEQEGKVWKDHILKGKKKFWEGLAPLPDARAELKQLNRLAKLGHEVTFISTRMGEQAKAQTETWLYNNWMSFPTVILSDKKVPLIRDLGIDFFIDDKWETIDLLARTAETEKWKIGGTRPPCSIYLKSTPYNKGYEPYNGVVRVSGVKEALQKEGLWRETGG